METPRRLSFLVLIGTTLSPAWGQTGCVNSPENPTIILLLAGVVAMLIGNLQRRARIHRDAPSSPSAESLKRSGLLSSPTVSSLQCLRKS